MPVRWKNAGARRDVPGVHVERAADADPDRAAGRGQVPRQPKLLFGRAQAGQQHVRAAGADRRGDRGALVVGRSSRCARRRSARRGAPRAAPRPRAARCRRRRRAVQADVADLGRARGQRVDERDAGHALAQRAAAQPRGEQQPDRVAGDQRGAADRARNAASCCAAITISTPSVTTSAGASPLGQRATRCDGLVQPTASTRQPRTSNDARHYGLYGAIAARAPRPAVGHRPSGERHGPTRKP